MYSIHKCYKIFCFLRVPIENNNYKLSRIQMNFQSLKSAAQIKRRQRGIQTAKNSTKHAKHDFRRYGSPQSNDGQENERQRFSEMIKNEEEQHEVTFEIYDTESECGDDSAQEIISQPFRSARFQTFSPQFMTPMGSGTGSQFFKTGPRIWESATSTDKSVKFIGNDNVKVCIRVRPFNKTDQGDENDAPLQIDEDSQLIKIEPKRNGFEFQYRKLKEKKFYFDSITDHTIDQKELFNMIAKPIADNCLEGINGCIFAYGQTGAGKTYTIQGCGSDESDRGILQRSFEYLFDQIKKKRQNSASNEFSQHILKCTYFEIYNEHINDLLRTDDSQDNLLLREDTQKGVQIVGITTVQVNGYDDVLHLLEKGTKRRKTASTKMNENSSRSHSVLSCFIQSKSFGEGMLSERFSTFHIIDLAGSESNKSSMAEGSHLKEAGMINKSLSALGLVIKTLSEQKTSQAKHIPYRSSKLTFILKNSLGGNSKTLVIGNVSPSWSHLSETISTLNFAKRAKLMKNQAQVNDSTTINVQSLQNEIMKLKCQVFGLQEQHLLQDEEYKEPLRSKSASREETSLETSNIWKENMLQMKVQSKMLELSIKESLVSMKTEEDLFNQAFQVCPQETSTNSEKASQIEENVSTQKSQINDTCQKMTQTDLNMSQDSLSILAPEEQVIRKQNKYQNSKILEQKLIGQVDNQLEILSIKQQLKLNKNILILGANQNIKNLQKPFIQQTLEQLIESKQNRILIVDPSESPGCSEESRLQSSVTKVTEFDVTFSKADIDLVISTDLNDDQTIPQKFLETPLKSCENRSTKRDSSQTLNENLELFADNLVAEVNSLKITIEQRNQMIEKLEEKLQTHVVFQDIRELKEENEKLKVKMEEENREYLEQINAAHKQKKLVKARLHEAIIENSKLKNELQNQNSEIEQKNLIRTQLENIINQMKFQHDEYTSQLQKVMTDQKEMIDNEQMISGEKIRALQDEIEDLRAQCTLQTSRSKRMSIHNDELVHKLSQLKSRECSMDKIQKYSPGLSMVPPLQLEKMLENKRITLFQDLKEMENQDAYYCGRKSQSPRFDYSDSPESLKKYMSRPVSQSPSIQDTPPSLSENTSPLHSAVPSPKMMMSLQNTLSAVPQELSRLEQSGPEPISSISSRESVSNSEFSGSQSDVSVRISVNPISFDKDDEIIEDDPATNLRNHIKQRLSYCAQSPTPKQRLSQKAQSELFGKLNTNQKKGFNSSRIKCSTISESGFDDSGFFEEELDEFRSFARSMDSEKDGDPLMRGYFTPRVEVISPQKLSLQPQIMHKRQSTPNLQFGFLIAQQVVEIGINSSIHQNLKQTVKNQSTQVDTAFQNSSTQVEKAFQNSQSQVDLVQMFDKEVSVKMKVKSRHVGIQNKLQTQNQSSQYEVEYKESGTQHFYETQEQATLCGGPPRRSQGLQAQPIELISKEVMTQNFTVNMGTQPQFILLNEIGTMTDPELKKSELSFIQTTPKVKEISECFVPNKKLSELILKSSEQGKDYNIEEQQRQNYNIICQKHTKIVQNLSKTIDSLKKELKDQLNVQKALSAQEIAANIEKKAMTTVIEMYKKQVLKIEDENKQFQISLNEISNSKALTFDIGINCKPETQDATIDCTPQTREVSIYCTPMTKDQTITVKPLTQDSEMLTESPPKKVNASTFMGEPKTKDSSCSPWIQRKNQSSSTDKFSLISKGTQHHQDHRDFGSNTSKLTSHDKSISCLLSAPSKSTSSQYSPAPLASTGTQCSIGNTPTALQKKLAALQKENDELQSRLAEKSFTIKENNHQIFQLQSQLENDSIQIESNIQVMSQISADFDKRNELENETLKNLQKKIDEKKGQIQKLESQLANKCPVSSLLEDGIFRDSDSEEVKEIKKEIKERKNQMKTLLQEVEKQKQEIKNEFKLSNTQKVRSPVSQLNSSSDDEDSSLKQQIADCKSQLEKIKKQHEGLQKKLKFEVETSSRNAKYFLEQNIKAEAAYDQLIQEYNIVRQEKFEKEKQLIQIKMSENLFEKSPKVIRKSLRKIMSSVSQVPKIKNQLAERNHSTVNDQLYCSSSDEVENKYLQEQKDQAVTSRSADRHLEKKFSSQIRQNSSVNTKSRGHSVPKFNTHQLEFSYNVVHQEVQIKNKQQLKTRKMPSLCQIAKPLTEIKEVRNDLKNWVSTNNAYDTFDFGF